MPEHQSGYVNGRVSTRDLLTAVEGSEERITHRIDRFEESVTKRFQDHDTRLAVLETEQAIGDARSRSAVQVVAGVKGFVLVGVAVVSMVVGALSLTVAQDANLDAFHQEPAATHAYQTPAPPDAPTTEAALEVLVD